MPGKAVWRGTPPVELDEVAELLPEPLEDMLARAEDALEPTEDAWEAAEEATDSALELAPEIAELAADASDEAPDAAELAPAPPPKIVVEPIVDVPTAEPSEEMIETTADVVMADEAPVSVAPEPEPAPPP